MPVSALNSLFNLGDDASSIQCMVYINKPSTVEGAHVYGLDSNLEFRATTYSLPSTNTKTVTHTYRGSTYEKPVAGDSDDTKTLTLTFRCDKYWRIYHELRKWKEAIYNSQPEGGVLAEDTNPVTGLSPNRTDIVVKTIDSAGEETGQVFVYEKAYITSIPQVSFDQSSTSPTPIALAVTFDYFKVRNEFTKEQ